MDGKTFKHKFSTGKFTVRTEEIDGLCSYPESNNSKTKAFLDSHSDSDFSISISPKIKGKRRLEVIIHESLHAEFPSIASSTEEDWVEAASSSISKLLWRMGYREM
jgi:hypothetical protein